ncbi:MAG: HAMP domain-containing protein [Candidatus Rokubacteria bacterium]|nr:HAMP domain-containing protein [Candidatus Rokubacteria bacterium]
MLARLLIGFLAVIVASTVLLGAVTAYSVASLDRVNHQLVQIMRSREAVADLRLTLAQVGDPLGGHILGRDPGSRERFEGLIRDAEAKLRSCSAAPCHLSTRTPENMAEALTPLIARVKAEGRRVFEAGPQHGTVHAEMVRQSIGRLRDAVEPMLAAERVSADELDRAAEAVEWRAWFLAGLLTIGISLGGSTAAIILARRISRPLSDLVSGTRRVVAGDWAYQANVAAPAEIGELAVSFNAMVHEIRQQREQLEEQNRTLEARVRRRTEALRQKEQALVQSEKLASLGLLAAGVAHELNNPLTSIVMNANLLSEEVGEGSPLHRELRKIDADAGRCRRIIEDLRAFARLRHLQKVPGDVAAVVDQAVSLVAHEMSRRQVHVRRDLAPDLPKVAWDPDRMVQVLSNLLVNSAQALGRGGRIVIRGQCDDGWLRLEVEDNGVGIPAEHRGRVFDPFFTTKPDGTGLGLSISHGIVNEHGGRIEVDSRTREEVGGGGETGTTVRVIVPIGEKTA